MAENWPELAVLRAVFATPIPKTNITGFWSAGLELTNIYTIRNWTPRPPYRPMGPPPNPLFPGTPPNPRISGFGGFSRIPGKPCSGAVQTASQTPPGMGVWEAVWEAVWTASQTGSQEPVWEAVWTASQTGSLEPVWTPHQTAS